tara:strand:- start:565 stop:840 length:276 start_codon:yes stop_codon:yes gene_type:complete
MMSKEYYICTSYDSTPQEVVEYTVAEINYMLKSKGIYIREYEPDDTDGYDYKVIFEIDELATEPAKTKTKEEHFDECLREWSKTKKQTPSL